MKTTPMNLAILAIFGFGVLKLVEAMQAKAAPALPAFPTGTMGPATGDAGPP